MRAEQDCPGKVPGTQPALSELRTLKGPWSLPCSGISWGCPVLSPRGGDFTCFLELCFTGAVLMEHKVGGATGDAVGMDVQSRGGQSLP